METNYPPGVTDADITEHFGSDEEGETYILLVLNAT